MATAAGLSDPVMGREVCVSVDPAQTSDFMATSLLRLERVDDTGKAVIRLLGATRSQNVRYDVQVKQIVRLVKSLYDRGANGVQVIIDSGGVGKSVLDHTRSASALTSGAIGISMHGGERSWSQHADRTVRASKLSVVGALQASFETKRVLWDPDTPGLPVLYQEIRDLRAKQTSTGAIKIEARAGRHDDVLFSLAQANFLLVEGCDGEDAIWNESTSAFYDRLHGARAPNDVEDYTLPEDLFVPQGPFEQERPARYRFTWRR